APAVAGVVFVASWLAWPIEGFAGPMPPGVAVCFWVGVALMASGSPVHVPRGSLVSVSAAPVVASAILGGPTAAAIVAVIGTLELRELRGKIPWYGSVYNHSFIVIPAVLSGFAYSVVAGSLDNSAASTVTTPAGLVAGVAAGVTYVFTTTALSSLAVALRENRAYSAVLQSDLRSVGLTMVGLTPIAWLMALAYVFIGPLVAFVFALPLYTTRAAIKAVVDIRNMFTQTVRALASAIDARDPSTRKHSDHVSGIAVEIGEVMSLSEPELEQLEWAGLLHDIGKIGIRDAVLLKPERLTREERMLMNEHPAKGEEILRDVDQLAKVRPLIRHHHEWYNGSGYPDRLIGEEIPLLARVLHVADAFEAMTASRPYRPVPLSSGEALAELQRYAGIQFDPLVVDAFSRTRSAELDRADDDQVRGDPERTRAAVPTLGQVAAVRARGALPSSSAVAET
ncbi:MAG TPA: HD-GYP domain-containing protein, partial [Candidatus Deferrimicrobium sp.]|nr:HD-GYP domain-containing protein [Candidatus Deferrimicrobium sp.]